ncbi:hypothetical protein VPH35_134270 [Triticum aestivum]
MHMCCHIPLIYVESFEFIGASYVHLFFARKQSCLVVDVFAGIIVSPPNLPNDEDTHPYYAALTAPLVSPNSHLLVITVCQTFFWRVGSQSWLRCSHIGMPEQVVIFSGQVFVMGFDHRLLLGHLVPQIHLQEIAIDWVGEGSTSLCTLDYVGPTIEIYLEYDYFVLDFLSTG